MEWDSKDDVAIKLLSLAVEWANVYGEEFALSVYVNDVLEQYDRVVLHLQGKTALWVPSRPGSCPDPLGFAEGGTGYLFRRENPFFKL